MADGPSWTFHQVSVPDPSAQQLEVLVRLKLVRLGREHAHEEASSGRFCDVRRRTLSGYVAERIGHHATRRHDAYRGGQPRTRGPVAHHHSPTHIVFTRFLPGADTGSVYRIDAGTTAKHLIRSGVLDFALLSPDATQFADFAFTSAGVGTTAIFNVDGSGYRLLPTSDPAIPPNGLPAGTWSAGETRIAAAAGDPGNIPPSGIFSRRSSDGRGVIRLTDAGSRFDYPVRSSPDGSKLLFFRPDAKNETSDSAPQDLFVVGANGKGMTRLTPQGDDDGRRVLLRLRQLVP